MDANGDEMSCALDHFTETLEEMSRMSDTVPSLSIDESTQIEQNLFLKEHYEKIEQLRKENFDLKLKLYLCLEATGKLKNHPGKVSIYHRGNLLHFSDVDGLFYICRIED